jgi:hypothetical protein
MGAAKLSSQRHDFAMDMVASDVLAIVQTPHCSSGASRPCGMNRRSAAVAAEVPMPTRGNRSDSLEKRFMNAKDVFLEVHRAQTGEISSPLS